MQPQDPFAPQPQQPQSPQPTPQFQPPQPQQMPLTDPAFNPQATQQPSFAQPPVVASVEDPGKSLSLAGVITGVLIPIVGIPLSVIGMMKSKKAGYSGKLGVVGIFVGIASFVLSVILTIAVPLILASSLNDSAISTDEINTAKEEINNDFENEYGISEENVDYQLLGKCVAAKGVDYNSEEAVQQANKECLAEQ